jgi:hypothetical protein
VTDLLRKEDWWARCERRAHGRAPSAAGKKPFWAFTAGVAVNLVIGFVLAVLVFGSYWAAL